MVTRLLKNGKSRAPTKEKVLRSVLSPCDGVHGVLKNKFGYAGVAPLSWKCYAALAPFIYITGRVRKCMYAEEPRCLKPDCTHLVEYRSFDIFESLK